MRWVGGEAIHPPNIHQIVKNVKEINELRRKLKEQKKAVGDLDKYLTPPSPLKEKFDEFVDKETEKGQIRRLV